MDYEQRKALADAVAKLQADHDAMGVTLRQLQKLIPAPKGTRRGERSGLWEKVRVLYARGMPIAQIARELDVRYQSVRQCIVYQKAGGG